VSPERPGDPADALAALVREYDRRWSALDIAGLAELWELGTPQPIYLADEYPTPLIGRDELDRHWSRFGGRLKKASVSSQLRYCDVLADGYVRCVVLSRWSYTGRESDVAHTGASWITWLLVARGDAYRICHHMETQVYLPDGDG
jgi:hypothetical protein